MDPELQSRTPEVKRHEPRRVLSKRHMKVRRAKPHEVRRASGEFVFGEPARYNEEAHAKVWELLSPTKGLMRRHGKLEGRLPASGEFAEPSDAAQGLVVFAPNSRGRGVMTAFVPATLILLCSVLLLTQLRMCSATKREMGTVPAGASRAESTHDGFSRPMAKQGPNNTGVWIDDR